jgi:hypothetical protein
MEIPLLGGGQGDSEANSAMKFSPLRIDSEAGLGTGVVLMSGSLIVGERQDFVEASRWPRKPKWARSPETVDSFATIYHNVEQIRTRNPFLVLFVSTIPGRGHATGLHERVFKEHPNVRLRLPFVIMGDGDFHESNRKDLENYLFDVGRGEFSDFGAMQDDTPSFSAAFLLSKEKQGLEAVRRVIEQVPRADQIREKLLSVFDVFFVTTEETDFVLITKDFEVAEGMRRANRTRPPEGHQETSPL